MHLFLVRHGETEHNVAGLLAGISDSRLTNHGVLQTQRLGKYLSAHRNLRFTHIFASDLQRAYMTADEIRKHQALKWPESTVPEVVRLNLLREQDFGYLELVPWASRRVIDPPVPDTNDAHFRAQESAESMATRADLFLTDFVVPLLAAFVDNEQDSTSECVAIVSHGLFLSALWQSILAKFDTGTVILGPSIEIVSSGRPLEYLPSWSNTGFLELSVYPNQANADGSTSMTPKRLFTGRSMTIHTINGKEHLADLKRTRGGLGSAPFDARQKSLDGFLKQTAGDVVSRETTKSHSPC